jgi:PPOX class probable F420-dependent enzyme
MNVSGTGRASYDPAEAIGNRPAIRQNRAMLSDAQRRFLDDCRIGHLATADREGMPHVIPVCYAVRDETLYITIDEKPKRQDRPLKRVRNMLENPQAAFVADRYAEDWRRLGWVMLRGSIQILENGPEHDQAQELLRARYPQYRAMSLAGLPVIALRIERAVSWGDLSAG